MRLGSLCSGYGGLELGISQVLDIEPVWCSEIDKDASKVLATHHPDVPNLGDLTDLEGMWGALEPVEIICAGFPCQPFSVAGLKKGEADERAIFPYIAGGVAAIRPRFVVLENVPGIAIHGVGVVATLAGLGYNCRWGVVGASDAGAPHVRARWWCVAEIADAGGMGWGEGTGPGEGEPAELRRNGPGDSNGAATTDTDSAGWGEQRRPVAMGTQQRPTERRSRQADFGPYTGAVEQWEHILGRPAPAPTDDKRRLSPHFVEWMMGLPDGWVCDVGLSRTAALKMLGNGVVPQQAALAVELLSGG